MTEGERISRAWSNAIVRLLREIREQERRRMLAAAEGGEEAKHVGIELPPRES